MRREDEQLDQEEAPAVKTMNEAECLKAVAAGESAYDLLLDAMPEVRRRFNYIDQALIRLLADVKRHFPDAEYYTASGGFNLMIGHSHSGKHAGQQQLLALGGLAQIGDGDF